MSVKARVVRALTPLAILFAATPPAATSARMPEVVRRRVDMGDWRLNIASNPFSGAVTCRLRARGGRAFYEGGAIGFRFDRDRDVADAVYRIDGAAPRRWRDDLPDLLALGTPIDTGDMQNPGEGIVRVPWRRLAAANSIVIQARRDADTRAFRFRGLKGLYAVAVQRGCTPDARFVR